MDTGNNRKLLNMVNEQLKTLEKYINEQEKAIHKHLSTLENDKEKEFLKKSYSQAKRNELNIESFLEQLKKWR